MSPMFVDNDGKFNWRKVGYHARSVFAVLLSVAVLAGGGYFVFQKANEAWTAFRTEDDYAGAGVNPIEVTVPAGASVTQIGDVLVEADVIKSTGTFRKVAARNPDSTNLQPGRYTLITQIPAETALEMMLDPENLVTVRVTLQEGLTLGRQWTRIQQELGEQGIEITRDELAAGVIPEELALPVWSRGKIEGFMFPDTYQVAEPVSATRLFKTQAARFTSVTDEIEFKAAADAMGIDPFDLVTVASIVEREVNQEKYRPMVARVILNRMTRGMLLQMDSTVHYATQDFSTVTTTAEDRAVDSPYNTYRYVGLPPGAISNPGRAALDAAAHPSVTDALFFVTVDLDTGETLFAPTLEAHKANVVKFQQWCQANEGRC